MNATHALTDSPFAEAIAAFLASGGQIEQGPAPVAERPRRSDKIDPDTILRRQRTPAYQRADVVARYRELSQTIDSKLQLRGLLGISASDLKTLELREAMRRRQQRPAPCLDNDESLAQAIAELGEADHGICDAARILGIGEAKARRLAKAHAISMPNKGRPAQIDDHALAALARTRAASGDTVTEAARTRAASGDTVTEAARTLRVGRARLVRVAEEHAIEFHRGSRRRKLEVAA